VDQGFRILQTGQWLRIGETIRVNTDRYLDMMIFIIDYTLKVIMKVISVHYSLVDLLVLLGITTDGEGGHIDLLEV
jgi:hypothetical protein